MIKTKEKGFLKIIVIVLIALALLKILFDFDIFNFARWPIVADAIDYIWRIIKTIWDGFLGRIFWFAWNNLKYLAVLGWDNLLILLDKIERIASLMLSR